MVIMGNNGNLMETAYVFPTKVGVNVGANPETLGNNEEENGENILILFLLE